MTILPPKAPESVQVLNNQLFFKPPKYSSACRLQGYEVNLLRIIFHNIFDSVGTPELSKRLPVDYPGKDKSEVLEL